MLYLNTADICRLPFDWAGLVKNIEETTHCIHHGDYMQPIKPYVRYRDPKNRIIAMPGFVGGKINTAGIKWIASFPDNLSKGLPRAHSLTVLNNAETGQPVCVINTALVSAIRTAAVSGVVIKNFLDRSSVNKTPLNIGICGVGIIGRIHAEMIASLLATRLGYIKVFDKRQIDLTKLPSSIANKIEVCSSWREVYTDADIFLTATVSSERYVNLPPKKGSLQLNISLRDFHPELRKYMDLIVVDNWEEVCRENTDVEQMHKSGLLSKEQTISISDLVCNQYMKTIPANHTVMFNPMGMSAYDISIGQYYYQHAIEQGIGQPLNDDYHV